MGRVLMMILVPMVCFAGAVVIPHGEIGEFGLNGTRLKGVATAALGAREFEVWHSSFPIGGGTPLHTHESEEVFVFLKGLGKVVVGGVESAFAAPCTIICPANVPHQFFNTGPEPTEQVVVLGIGSEIVNAKGEVMNLPWRR